MTAMSSTPVSLLAWLRAAWPSAGPRRSTLPASIVRSLPHRAYLEVDARRIRSVRCLSGCLWITQDFDPRDIVIVAGERHAFRGSQPAMLSALQDAQFVLEP